MGTETLREIFGLMDSDHSGILTRDELEASFHSAEVQELLALMQISKEEVKYIYNVIDIKRIGQVTIDDFVDAILQTTQPMSSLDTYRLMIQGKYIIEMVSSLSIEMVSSFSQAKEPNKRLGVLTL